MAPTRQPVRAMNERSQRIFPSSKEGTEARYARIDNFLLRDERLSLGARGLAGYLLSQPPEWQFSAARLAAQGQGGVHVLEGYIRELERAGYVQRHKQRDPATGEIRTMLTLRESPTGENRQLAPTGSLPTVGEPTGRSTDGRQSAGLKNNGSKNDYTRDPSGAPPGAPEGPSKTRNSHARTPLLDALASMDGSDLSQVTGSSWRATGMALREIRAVCSHVTVEEINRRADNFHLRFPTATITPHALAKYWAPCEKGPGGNASEPVRVAPNIRELVQR
jgi:hypothetical protein